MEYLYKQYNNVLRAVISTPGGGAYLYIQWTSTVHFVYKYTPPQRKTAVTAYLKSKQLLLVIFAGQQPGLTLH